jgi:general stress protein YciG
VNKNASSLGKKGGKATLKRHGKEFYSKIGKLGAKKKRTKGGGN